MGRVVENWVIRRRWWHHCPCTIKRLISIPFIDGRSKKTFGKMWQAGHGPPWSEAGIGSELKSFKSVLIIIAIFVNLYQKREGRGDLFVHLEPVVYFMCFVQLGDRIQQKERSECIINQPDLLQRQVKLFDSNISHFQINTWPMPKCYCKIHKATHSYFISQIVQILLHLNNLNFVSNLQSFVVYFCDF